MIPIMTGNNNIGTLQDILDFELENNVKLPQDYIDFLLELNGGYPKPHYFKCNLDMKDVFMVKGQYVPIEYLDDIQEITMITKEDGEFLLPVNCLMIGESSDEKVFMSLRSHDYGYIYISFYKNTTNYDDYESQHLLLAKSFTEFINGFEENTDN